MGKTNPYRVELIPVLITALVVCGFLGLSSDDSGTAGTTVGMESLETASAAAIPSTERLVPIAKAATPSVVNISPKRRTKHGGKGFPPFFDDPLFRRFFGEEFEKRLPPSRDVPEQGLGSGVIVSSDGYIMTNNHVVDQADDIRVILSDKRSYKAKDVGTDHKTDLAIVKISGSNLPALTWGDSSKLQVGEIVLAIGNPLGLNQTVTMGIISAVGRANVGIVDYEDFIQTDAAINPGNSGGALVNLAGELIGINTAILSQTGGSMGIGFAIPSNMARRVMDTLIKHGKVVRGWLGVSIQELTEDLAKEFGTPDTKGALVADVLEDSPAAQAKIERGDVIKAYNGATIDNPTQLRALVADTAPGTTVTLSIWRNKETREIRLTVAELPKDAAKASRGRLDKGQGEHALAGVTVEEFTSDRSGRFGQARKEPSVVVRSVEPDSVAAEAGLRPGDIIREINRNPVRSVDDFEHLTRQLDPKESALILLSRDSSTIFLSIPPR